MFTLKGKYNSANILTDAGVDEATTSQIYTFLNHPAFAKGYIAIMPDCHAGKGSCVGFTMQMNDYVIPAVVGVDISCGMYTMKLPAGLSQIDFQALDDWIREKIPSGFHIHDMPNVKGISEYDAGQFINLSNKVGQKSGRALESIGTLGGGNHFISLDRSETGDIWVTIHSGSRNLGLAVAQYHQDRAAEFCRKALVTGIPRGLEYLPREMGGNEYLEDMKITQRYAAANREAMGAAIMRFFDCEPDESWHCIHNYISFDDNIIRKGAISAHEGERVLIPLNMRDGIIIGTGKGSKKWNMSAPHGAGRIYSRGKAKKELSVEDFESDMDGIWTSCVHRGTLDECPRAYKPKEVILDVIGETVDVEAVLKPIYNFKAS